MLNAPFSTLLFSPRNCGAVSGAGGWERSSETPFPAEHRGRCGRDSGRGLGEPVSSRTASLGALERRACALRPSPYRPCGRALAAVAAPGRKARSCRPGPAPGAWGELEGLGCEVQRPPQEGSGRLDPPQGARGPRKGARRPQLLSPFSLPRLRTASHGERESESKVRKGCFPSPRVVSRMALSPWLWPGSVHLCPSLVWGFAVFGLCSIPRCLLVVGDEVEGQMSRSSVQCRLPRTRGEVSWPRRWAGGVGAKQRGKRSDKC